MITPLKTDLQIYSRIAFDLSEPEHCAVGPCFKCTSNWLHGLNWVALKKSIGEAILKVLDAGHFGFPGNFFPDDIMEVVPLMISDTPHRGSIILDTVSPSNVPVASMLVVTHPGIAPASHSLNFGVPTNPKPVSSQKASCYEDARVVTHPGIAPASHSLNFGVLTTPKPVSSQKASCYGDASPLRHSDLGEAFWVLTGFGVVRTPKLSEWEAGAIPGWVTTLGSCSVSSQKQNRAGLGPKRTISCYGRAGPGRCSVSSQEQTREGPVVGAKADNIMLGGVGPVRCATLNLDEAFWELTGFGFVGTPKLSEWEAGAIPGWVTTLGSCFVSSQKQNRAGW
ncbi:hypothetical protein L3X38_020361 [Prunus dulcis]|uniref:Uncharacterized protein n=1 Tax=Prunus dulcis TaxID=3755 RepID=A0AAD4WFE0_PRUDU|nr:hypothetical protein L3X38_020361 [Prunus dulcis]